MALLVTNEKGHSINLPGPPPCNIEPLKADAEQVLEQNCDGIHTKPDLYQIHMIEPLKTDAEILQEKSNLGVECSDETTNLFHDFVIPQENSTDPLAMTNSQFANVVFHDVPETYTVNIDVVLKYSLTPNLIPSSRDWVGLYKVGWMSSRDYVCYEWAPIPPDLRADVSIIFLKKYLPNDNGEFYQFCYVSRSGQIRGASVPFQFRTPRADDYVEVEDEDDDLMVIRPSKVVLEEKLKSAQDDHKKLQQMYSVLEEERNDYRLVINKLKKDIQQEKKHNSEMNDLLENKEKAFLKCRNELQNQIEELEKNLVHVKMDKNNAEENISKQESDNASLTAELKRLKNDKDELDGTLQLVVDEKEQYKLNIMSSEATAAGHLHKIESLEKHLRARESEVATLELKVAELISSLSSESEKVQEQQATSSEVQVILSQMKQKLSYAESDLGQCKKLNDSLKDELAAFVLTQEKMSRDLENSELERFNCQQRNQELTQELEMIMEQIAASQSLNMELKRQIEQMSDQMVIIPSLKDQIDRLTKEVEGKEALDASLVLANSKISELDNTVAETKGSLFALQEAHKSMKYRQSKYKNAYDDARKRQDQLITVQNLHVEREVELKREIEDMKERLHLCTEEYKTLCQKNMKLEKKLAKSIKTKSAATETASTECVDHEKYQMGNENHANYAENTEKIVFDGKDVPKSDDAETITAIHPPSSDAPSVAICSDQKDSAETSGLFAVTSENVLERLPNAGVTDYAKPTNTVPPPQESVIDYFKSFFTADKILADNGNEPSAKHQHNLDASSDCRKLQQIQTIKQTQPIGEPLTNGAKICCKEAVAAVRKEMMEMQAEYERSLLKLQSTVNKKDGEIKELKKLLNKSPGVAPFYYPEVFPVYPVMPYGNQPMSGDSLHYPSITDSQALLTVSPNHPQQEPLIQPHIQLPPPTQSRTTPIDEPISGDISSLDPPLEPHVTSDAKVAAVKSVWTVERPSEAIEDDGVRGIEKRPIADDVVRLTEGETLLDDGIRVTGSNLPILSDGNNDQSNSSSSAPIDNSLKICVTCGDAFPSDISDTEFEVHVLSHVRHYCPLCMTSMDWTMTQTDFERHVNQHFNQ